MTETQLREIHVIGEGPEAERHAAAWQSFAPRVQVSRAAAPTGGAPFAASVCGPVERRAEVAGALLRRGAHVLVAAPVAADAAAAGALVAAADAAGRLFVPAHPLLYPPGMLRLMAYVVSRKLGAVQNVYAYRYGPAGARLRYEPAERDAAWELNALAAFTKVLALLPESRLGAVTRDERGDLRFAATMYYDDDILATVRVDPDTAPPRRGVMVTCADAVLQWEVDAAEERLTFQRGPGGKALPVGSEEPYGAMIGAFLKAAVTGAPPYEPAAAAVRTLTLLDAWRAATAG